MRTVLLAVGIAGLGLCLMALLCGSSVVYAQGECVVEQYEIGPGDEQHYYTLGVDSEIHSIPGAGSIRVWINDQEYATLISAGAYLRLDESDPNIHATNYVTVAAYLDPDPAQYEILACPVVVVETTPTPTVSPTATPTPAPSVLSYTISTVLDAKERRDVQFDVDCERIGTLTCEATGSTWLYGNGLRVGQCGEACSPFYTRYPLPNTLTLLNREAVPNTIEVVIECDMSAGSMSYNQIPPTPTLYPFPLPREVTGTMGIQSVTGGGIPMPNFADTYPTWLGFAQTTINMVNKGNFLWVFGAIQMAGLVLAWGISEVKNPRSWR